MRDNLEVAAITIEHVRVWTERPFAEVVRCLEKVTAVFDAAQINERTAARQSPDAIIAAIEAMAGESGFMRFATWDHGAALRLTGHRPAEAVRFVIGNPLIAVRMTSHRIGSGLYAPLSLLVSSDEGGGTLIEYDRPSTLLAQFHDAEITRTARELDQKLEALIQMIAAPH
jgi:uncharacterized protein (DUF302 family)